MTDQSKDLEVLKRLAKHVTDSADGYDEAAKVAKDPQLVTEFAAMGRQRRAMAEALKGHIAAMGGKLEESGSVAASAHRAFMNLRAAAQDDTKAAIAEVERGEDFLRDTVRDALKEVSTNIRAALEPIAREVQEGHDRWSALKHRLSGASSGPGGEQIA